MNLAQDYESKLKELDEKVQSSIPEEEASALKRSLDDVLPFVILLLIFVVVLNFFAPVSNKMATWVTYANYLVIIYFASRLAVEYRLKSPDEDFFREHLLDFLMVVPAFSILEEVRLLKVLRGSVAPEFITSSVIFRTGVAARMTKISRITKRALGL